MICLVKRDKLIFKKFETMSRDEGFKRLREGSKLSDLLREKNYYHDNNYDPNMIKVLIDRIWNSPKVMSAEEVIAEYERIH